MVRKIEYDFLTWTSFPSSIKLLNDEPTGFVGLRILWDYPVKGGETVKVEAMVKGENLSDSHMYIRWWDGRNWRDAGVEWLPKGTFDWRKFTMTRTIGTPARLLRISIAGGRGLAGKLGITWVDDVKVWINGELIYANDFSCWNPYIGAGIGALATAVPAYLATRKPEYSLLGILGAAAGGLIGWLTAKP